MARRQNEERAAMREVLFGVAMVLLASLANGAEATVVYVCPNPKTFDAAVAAAPRGIPTAAPTHVEQYYDTFRECQRDLENDSCALGAAGGG